jgi:two-component system, LuxR family, response regulator FixJ
MPRRLDVVCVVEDDAAVRGALKFALELEELAVRAYDGPVSLLSDRNLPPFDCLVIDYRMPVMDGLELTAALRERGIEAPAIMITGQADKELRTRAERLGICLILEKPLADGALIESIRAVLKSSG